MGDPGDGDGNAQRHDPGENLAFTKHGKCQRVHRNFAQNKENHQDIVLASGQLHAGLTSLNFFGMRIIVLGDSLKFLEQGFVLSIEDLQLRLILGHDLARCVIGHGHALLLELREIRIVSARKIILGIDGGIFFNFFLAVHYVSPP